MKKFSLLLCLCLAALMVPQRVWADDNPAFSDDDKTMTITTTASGQVSGLVSSLSSDKKSGVTKIVLNGTFSATDLEQIQYSRGFDHVTTVDMSEARFSSSVTYESSDWYLYHSAENLPTTANLRTQAIVDGTLYRYEGSRTWNPISYPSGQTITPYVSSEAMESDKESVAVGSYAKYPTGYTYRQLIVSGESWNVLSYAPSGEIITVTWSDIMRNDYVHDFTAGQKIKAKHYYKWVSGNWIECTTSGDLAGLATSDEIIDGAAFKAVEGSLDGSYGHDGSYIWFWHYFEKTETGRSWSEPGSSDSFKEGDFDENERDNYKSSYKHGDWVRMRVYSYYRLDIDASNSWKAVAYDDGFHINTTNIKNSKSEVDAISEPNYGDYAVVINNDNQKKIVFDGTSWVSFSVGTVLSDFSEMKFDYWKETLTTAITSNYATETISSSIFDNCKNLTSVDYRSGNVTGFENHNANNGYSAPLNVTIGKDVTKIDDNSFKECDVLQTVSFDKDYSGGTAGYPKQLTIGSQAFMECLNLQGIEIPNRVTNIGFRAFYRAGNGVKDTLPDPDNKESGYDDNRTFSLSFERRNSLDNEEGVADVSIDYDCELVIGEEAFMDCIYLKSLSLPIRLKSMGKGAFKNTFGMTSLTMREQTKSPYLGDKLQTIPEDAFNGSHVTSIVIPKSVTLIEKWAFANTNHLAAITIQSEKDPSTHLDLPGQPTLIIKSAAFTGGNEAIVPNLHVYVDIDPTKRLIICEYDAFTYTQMQGQTDVQNNHKAVLHFNKAYWDYYQGDWKKGLAFLQSNLNAFKDGYTDTDKLCMGKYGGDVSNINTTTGKYEYNAVGPADGQFAPGNGWQEFVGTDTGIDIVIPEGNYIRTYSTNTPYYIPLFEKGGLKKYLMKIYRVTSYDDGYVYGDKDDRETANERSRKAYATEVVGKIDNRIYIPAATGLLLLGQGENNKYLIYQDEVATSDRVLARGYVEYEYNKIVGSGSPEEGTTNLLYPTCVDTSNEISSDGKVILNPTKPYPINFSNGLNDTYRLFVFRSPSDIRGFHRSQPGVKVDRDKAYLKLPVSMFHWSDEEYGTEYEESSSSGLSRISILFDEEENEQTGIDKPVTTETSDGSFYSIQGIKHSRPVSKGLYLYKGKKIFVK